MQFTLLIDYLKLAAAQVQKTNYPNTSTTVNFCAGTISPIQVCIFFISAADSDRPGKRTALRTIHIAYASSNATDVCSLAGTNSLSLRRPPRVPRDPERGVLGLALFRAAGPGGSGGCCGRRPRPCWHESSSNSYKARNTTEASSPLVLEARTAFELTEGWACCPPKLAAAPLTGRACAGGTSNDALAPTAALAPVPDRMSAVQRGLSTPLHTDGSQGHTHRQTCALVTRPCSARRSSRQVMLCSVPIAPARPGHWHRLIDCERTAALTAHRSNDGPPGWCGRHCTLSSRQGSCR
jgi:hypothetical protein